MRQALPTRRYVALVVDDDEYVRGFVREVLEKEGFEVHIAEGGKTGISIYEKQPDLSLIVTDILMPEADGIDFIFQIRHRTATGAAQPKIIAISGGGSIEAQVYLEDAKGLGADVTIEKPFSAFDLREALSHLGFDLTASD